MTRLTDGFIGDMGKNLGVYDAELRAKTGMDLKTLAFCSVGGNVPPESVVKSCKAAVVRISTGLGVIGTFAESVAAVIRHMGGSVSVPESCDVSGIHEAAAGGAKVLFMADDDRFIALNVKTGAVAENDIAVAAGYVTALSGMAGGLSGKEVTLLGFGRLGRRILGSLINKGAYVNVYDRDSGKTLVLSDGMVKESSEAESGDGICGEIGYNGCEGKAKVLLETPRPLSGLVVDATSEGNYLGINDLAAGVRIAAPGIPLSLDGEAYEAHKKNIIHDPLEIGVAVMLAQLLIRGADRMDYIDPKSMQPGETPGLPAKKTNSSPDSNPDSDSRNPFPLQ